ncbi:glycosyltransferase family 2 protein [Clostridium pasteurianum]|uniref:Putative glycosyltransferase n=1 Tax=Clostridium pasteurianum BC1 TaxID=86416 RepID=R4KE46_CLOPA|nr:glycosyltransferase [Clostridium pasteurianum]AGK97890.1 putative glycosyltransferase [Clostridium pasteurianum BC1]
MDNLDIIEASVIIPCKNEINNLKMTLDSIKASKNKTIYEIIVVDDESEDNSVEFLKLQKNVYNNIVLIESKNLGCAGAKNAGAEIAKGGYLFFIDAHVKVTDYWLDNLINTMKNNRADLVAPCICNMKNVTEKGYGENWTENLKLKWILKKPEDITEIPIACGCAFGIKKDVFENVNGFDHFFQVWGREDEEICLKLWLYGYRVVVNPFVKIEHLFRKKFPYEMMSVNVTYNTLCMTYLHFNKKRIAKTIAILKFDPFFDEAAKFIKKNFHLIMFQRTKYFKKRKFDDNYFFKKFNIPY